MTGMILRRLQHIGIGIVGLTGIGLVLDFFWGGGVVFAQLDPADINQISTVVQNAVDATAAERNFARFLELILKVIYMFMRPLLAIAGASMDNSLIYGEVFRLDVSLWQFWQITRNFANFALGFFFIAGLLFAVLGIKQEKFGPKKLLPKLLLGAVLIQASRWMVAALIDLSTVGTYTVGALPLHVAKNSPDDPLNNVRHLKETSVNNLSQTNQQTSNNAQIIAHYSCKPADAATSNYIFLPCLIEESQLVCECENPNDTDCREVYRDDFILTWNNAVTSATSQQITVTDVNDDFCVLNQDLIPRAEACGSEGGLLKPENLLPYKREGQTEMEARGCPAIPEFFDSAAGLAGPLYALYSSILNMGDISRSATGDGVISSLLEFMVKTLIGIAMMVPLIALAAVLLIRAVVLWLVIAASPLLVLGYVFDIELISKKKGSLSNVLGLIFLPVTAVFGVSISILFLTLVGRLDLVNPAEQCYDVSNALGIYRTDVDEDCLGNLSMRTACYDLFGITELCFTEKERAFGNNILFSFSYLLTSFFGIALMWAIVFAALKTSEVTNGVVKSIEGLGKQVLTTTPLIPLPPGLGGGRISAAGLKGTGRKLQSGMQNKALEQYEGRLGGWLDDQRAQASGTVRERVEEVETDVNNFKKGGVDGMSLSDTDGIPQALAQQWNLNGVNNWESLLRSEEGIRQIQNMGQNVYEEIPTNWSKSKRDNLRAADSQQLMGYMTNGLRDLAADPTVEAYTFGTDADQRYWFNDRLMRMDNESMKMVSSELPKTLTADKAVAALNSVTSILQSGEFADVAAMQQRFVFLGEGQYSSLFNAVAAETGDNFTLTHTIGSSDVTVTGTRENGRLTSLTAAAATPPTTND